MYTPEKVMIILFILSCILALIKLIVKQYENQITALKARVNLLDQEITDKLDRLVNCIQVMKVKIGEIDGRLISVGNYHEALRLILLEKKRES